MTSAEIANRTPEIQTDSRLVAGRYRTGIRLGSGRLGEIFAATDDHNVEQQLAVQVIPEEIVRNNRIFNQLNLGFSTLRSAAHPNIVGIRQFGRDGKFAFLAMDHLDGVSLRFVLDDAKTLDLDEAKPVIRGVGEALQLLHSKDMMHGNLTAKNVFISEEFEVRLLDVLPLDATQTVIRGAATNAPFSCCSVENDVFGLACLTYEMLAGKPPFDYSLLADNSLAELEADRITSLNDREWDALYHALAFDSDQRTPTIAKFMRDFGVDELERTLPRVDPPIRPEIIEYPSVAELTPTSELVELVELVEPAADTMVSEPDTATWPPETESINETAGPQRVVLLGVLLAGLGAWFYFGQSQEQVASLIRYFDESTIVEPTARTDSAVEIPTPEAVQTVLTDAIAPEVDLAAGAEESIVAAVPATSPQYEMTSDTEDEPAATDVEQSQAEPQVAFFEATVSVSERDDAARIVAPHTTGYSEMPLVWWTSAHSASADDDFVSVQQQVITDTTTEGGNLLLVSLVNDNLPEPPESFFVNLGLHDFERGHIERTASIRVDIIDDD